MKKILVVSIIMGMMLPSFFVFADQEKNEEYNKKNSPIVSSAFIEKSKKNTYPSIIELSEDKKSTKLSGSQKKQIIIERKEHRTQTTSSELIEKLKKIIQPNDKKVSEDKKNINQSDFSQEKQAKIQQLKKAITQIIPVAEKIGYPIAKLQKYQQKLDFSQQKDIQELTKNIRQEIKKIRNFVDQKKTLEKKN